MIVSRRMDRSCNTNGEVKKNACRILMGMSEGKVQLGRPGIRWVDNIKMDLREIRWRGMVLTDLVEVKN
jgi:hypothetical protein